MKLKSIVNLNAVSVLSDEELKLIIGGKTYQCICMRDGQAFNLGYTVVSPAACNTSTCISRGFCQSSWDCTPLCVESSGSASGGSIGSGGSSNLGSTGSGS